MADDPVCGARGSGKVRTVWNEDVVGQQDAPRGNPQLYDSVGVASFRLFIST